MTLTRRIFLASSAAMVALPALAETQLPKKLSVQDAHRLAVAGDITLVDIRRPDEWARTGSGEGAQRLDMRISGFIAKLSDLVDGNRDAPIALICAGGVRSARMERMLTRAGFSQIIDVPEGMLGSPAGPGWVRSGLPVVR